MRGKPVNGWIAPLVRILLLFKISLRGDDGVKAPRVEMRREAKFTSVKKY